MNPSLPKSLRIYITLTAVAGLVWLAFLGLEVEWEIALVGETVIFTSATLGIRG